MYSNILHTVCVEVRKNSVFNNFRLPYYINEAEVCIIYTFGLTVMLYKINRVLYLL